MISRAARKRLGALPFPAHMFNAMHRLVAKYGLGRGHIWPNPHHAAGRARTGGIPWRGKR